MKRNILTLENNCIKNDLMGGGGNPLLNKGLEKRLNKNYKTIHRNDRKELSYFMCCFYYLKERRC